MTSSPRVLLVIAAALVLTGCTTPGPDVSAPTPSPTSTPESTLSAPEWAPDLTIEREFTGEDGTKTCTILLHVPDAPSSANAELTEAVAAAKTFLTEGDWSAVEVSLDEFDPTELASRRDQGVSDPELLTMLLQDRIREDMDAAGLLIPGLSTESQVSCV